MNIQRSLVLILFTSAISCSLFDNDNPDFFTVTPVSAVEVALKIRAERGDSISIIRSQTLVFSFRMASSDTVLIDSDLVPATSYIWKADNHARGGRWKPVELQTTTMDTTSHAFTWEKFEFGEYSSSFIRDVDIIDSNNIWAVGEIYMNDSLGSPDFTPYNAVHWDGEEWEVKRITVDFRGNEVTPPLKVFRFSHITIFGL